MRSCTYESATFSRASSTPSRLDDLAVADVAAEGVAVVRDRRIEVVDRDRNVVDLREHAGSSHDTIVRPVSCAAGRA